MQTINYKEFNTSFTQIQHENTLKERNRMLSNGMEEITEGDLLQQLEKLNYKIDNSCSFNYYNTGNEIHYKARSVSFIDTKTKQSWAHVEQSFTNRENQQELQKIRMNNFVFKAGRIWEL